MLLIAIFIVFTCNRNNAADKNGPDFSDDWPGLAWPADKLARLKAPRLANAVQFLKAAQPSIRKRTLQLFFWHISTKLEIFLPKLKEPKLL